MLGDTAIAVHPDDARYRHLVGTEIELPLVGRMIPIVADAHVDPGLRHRRGEGHAGARPERLRDRPAPLATDDLHHGRSGPDHRSTATFQGMSREEARRAVTDDLREEGRIVAEKRPYVHSVGHCSRCDTVIEPRLSLQWFVRVEKLAQAAGDAVRDGRVEIVPASLRQRYFDWVDNMHDWCISRQLWWGHRIPVWYSPDGAEMVCVGPGETPAGRLDPGPRRARHLVLVGVVAVLDDGLAGARPRTWRSSIRRRSWSPATTSCSSGSSA